MPRSALVALLLGAGCSAPVTVDHDAAPADVARPDANPCGARGGTRGLSQRSVTIDGLARTYLVYLPAGDPLTPMPLVVVFHGYTMSGQRQMNATGYQAIADSDHVALAFPDGEAGPDSTGAPWNVGSDVCPSYVGPPPDATGDDFKLLDYIKGDVSDDQCVDTQHVFVTGFSMGAYFTHQVGCLRPDIRAIAPHSGGTHALDTCTTGHVPVIIFHGTSDPVIPTGCDDPAATAIAGVTPSADAWATRNGCALTTTTQPIENGTCATYDDCPADGQVELCTFTNMGHCWAGGPGSAGADVCVGYASATQLEWDFFKQHAW